MNYVLPIIGAYLIFNGMVLGSQATTAMQQIGGELDVGFGLLAIGIGALIGAVKIGFARLEKRLASAPAAAVPAAPAPEQLPTPPAPATESMLDRLQLMRPWTAD